jgi:hypothetical protein
LLFLIELLTSCWYVGSLSGRLLVSPVVRLVFSKVPPPPAEALNIYRFLSFVGRLIVLPVVHLLVFSKVPPPPADP